ncbi:MULTISPECIES: ATP-binding cassette domain-containing protein [unclassified Micromonospora]|uniref:ATP-binding cassette domain-containing protein n=1 Tax=unclassified Micromonospora TaxID=2617518 RepID=UPI003634978F
MTPLIEVTGLNKVFTAGSLFTRRRVHAVRDVSFTLGAGETYGLVGESGSGKSTVARLIARLDTPASGTIRLDGRDVAGARGRELARLRRDVQMVFQDPYGALNPRMTVRDLVYEPWRIHRLHTPAQRRGRLDRLLDQVGLPRWAADRKPVEFSGGQRQRIMIARALALEPRLLIADEPVSALDVSVQAQVLNVFKDLRDELGLACLFISHDLSVVEFVSDRIGVMYRGELIEQGRPADVYRAPATDYTRRLLDAIPRIADPAAEAAS